MYFLNCDKKNLQSVKSCVTTRLGAGAMKCTSFCWQNSQLVLPSYNLCRISTEKITPTNEPTIIVMNGKWSMNTSDT